MHSIEHQNRDITFTTKAVAAVHARDLEVQEKYGAKFMNYWYDLGTCKVFCLIEAPGKEAAIAVHKEAGGLRADEVIEVTEGK